ncbi:MAG TPA: hypothetical protein VMR62_24930 [Bryobacteraceae bacterium]|jgi:hypothetical protein|nr:hypothetical protein [Bryobacteraceae bacterium]
MQAFQTLTISGPSEKLRRMPVEIEKLLADGWSRDGALEARLNKSSFSPEIYCFHCEESPNREAADLSLSRNSNQLRVANIVPSGSSPLSYSQYNAILKEFAERFARPAAQGLGLAVAISRAAITVDDLLPPQVVDALKNFSDQANKKTGAANPNDRARWQEFVIGAHQAHSELDSDVLSDWLIQHGWTDTDAHDLAIEYVRGRYLLDQFERQPQHA